MVDVAPLGYEVIHDMKSCRQFAQQIADSLFGHSAAASIKGPISLRFCFVAQWALFPIDKTDRSDE